MKAHYFLLVVLANIWLGAGLVNAASITLTSNGEDKSYPSLICNPKIQFDGQIKEGDLDVLKSLVDKTCNKVKKNKNGYIKYLLSLNSDGGDVTTALSIGRFIRNLSFPVKSAHFEVWVFGRYKCNSSCVFLIAAGQSRKVYGKVGIHRPYFVELSPNLSTADIGRIRSEQTRLMKSYFAEMDVPESLLDAMLSIPPENIKILSESELKQYRIYYDDANFEEKETAELAKQWYLTSAEYRKRVAERSKKCSSAMSREDWGQYRVCEVMTMVNISKSEAQKRIEKSGECDSRDGLELLRCVFGILAGK